MIGFHLLFPDEAENEGRTVIPVGRADLPHRTFAFLEAYCADPECDCRRVMLNVIDARDAQPRRHRQLCLRAAQAAVRGRRTDLPRSAQSTDGDLAAFLEFTADMMARDRGCHDRLVRHYTMCKRVVDDPSHPGQEKLRAIRDHTDMSSRPVRRSAPKIAPNHPCPCGSGRTYKTCCRA